MAQRPTIAFDRIADNYDATRGGDTRGAENADELERWLTGAGTILEVGVGTGVVAGALRARGHAVLGMDLSPAMLARAVDRVGAGRLAVADGRALPVASATVSTVVFVYALHVIGDLATALAEAARVLRPGGRVLAVHHGADDEHTDITAALAPVVELSRARSYVRDDVLRAAHAAGL